MTTRRPVPGYEGLYDVSDTGEVRRVARSRASRQVVRVLTPSISTTGYPYVTLHRDGRAVKYKVHRLVALAFLERPDGATDVCHQDGDRLNPTLANLRWDTRSGNMRDTVKHGTQFNQYRDRTHCKNGHLFDEVNTLVAADGRRCRACRRDRVRAWRARQGGAAA